MKDRTVTDSAGRTWTCSPTPDGRGSGASAQGKDVELRCTTPSVDRAIQLTVGWNWEQMAANGLARKISEASPAPRR